MKTIKNGLSFYFRFKRTLRCCQLASFLGVTSIVASTSQASFQDRPSPQCDPTIESYKALLQAEKHSDCTSDKDCEIVGFDHHPACCGEVYFSVKKDWAKLNEKKLNKISKDITQQCDTLVTCDCQPLLNNPEAVCKQKKCVVVEGLSAIQKDAANTAFYDKKPGLKNEHLRRIEEANRLIDSNQLEQAKALLDFDTAGKLKGLVYFTTARISYRQNDFSTVRYLLSMAEQYDPSLKGLSSYNTVCILIKEGEIKGGYLSDIHQSIHDFASEEIASKDPKRLKYAIQLMKTDKDLEPIRKKKYYKLALERLIKGLKELESTK